MSSILDRTELAMWSVEGKADRRVVLAVSQVVLYSLLTAVCYCVA